jgi:hypothetical protein
MWDRLGAARWLLEPMAKVFKLALAATQEHCERIIGALRKIVSPFHSECARRT